MSKQRANSPGEFSQSFSGHLAVHRPFGSEADLEFGKRRPLRSQLCNAGGGLGEGEFLFTGVLDAVAQQFLDVEL